MTDTHMQKFLVLNTEPRNLQGFDIPLSLLVPRADFFLTQFSTEKTLNYDKPLLSRFFKDGLLAYMNVLYEQGYLNRNGITSNPQAYTLLFKDLNLKYSWIPKNACTFVKKRILAIADKDLLNSNFNNCFHETVQQHHGLSLQDYVELRDADIRSFAVIREPIERFVSCYVDKFLMPVIKGQRFENFAQNVILRIVSNQKINRDHTKSISFGEFLQFVTCQQPYELNDHWRPQYAYVGDQSAMAFCTTRNLATFLESVLSNGSDDLRKRENSSLGLEFSNKRQCSGRLRDMLPVDIKTEDFKDYAEFLSQEDYDLLFDFYQKDYAIYDEAESASWQKVLG